MNYICLILIIIICFCCYRKEKSLFSPSVSFSLLYVFIFILSSFGWFGIYDASDSAFELITLGVILFVTGALCQSVLLSRRRKIPSPIRIRSEEAVGLREKVYWIMIFILLVALSVSAVIVIIFLLSGGSIGDLYLVAAAATDGEDNELSKNPFQNLLESYVAYPLLYLIVPVSIVEFFHTYKKKYIIVAIILALIRVVLDARRTYLAAFIMMFVVCAILHIKDIKKADKEMKKKIRSFLKYSIVLVAVFVYLFSFISQQRSIAKLGEDDSSILQTLTYYYGGCVQFFGNCINTFKFEYTYGFSSLRGFFAPFFGVFRLFGAASPDVLEYANDYLVQLHSQTIQISPSKTYNSFATCFFQFYCDGGVIGIIVLSFSFGFLAQSLYNKMKTLKSKRAEATYLFFYANILMLSFVNMETVQALNFWPLILVRLLYPSIRTSHKKTSLK